MELLEGITEQKTSDKVLFVQRALFTSADVFLLVEVGAEREEPYQKVLFKEQRTSHQLNQRQLKFFMFLCLHLILDLYSDTLFYAEFADKCMHPTQLHFELRMPLEHKLDQPIVPMQCQPH